MHYKPLSQSFNLTPKPKLMPKFETSELMCLSLRRLGLWTVQLVSWRAAVACIAAYFVYSLYFSVWAQMLSRDQCRMAIVHLSLKLFIDSTAPPETKQALTAHADDVVLLYEEHSSVWINVSSNQIFCFYSIIISPHFRSTMPYIF